MARQTPLVQVETFDPKMDAPADCRSVTGAVASRIPGVAFGGTFPGLASAADQLAVVRSFTHGESDHTKAVEQVMRGGNPINRAGMGAIASRLRSTSHPRTGMPTHVFLGAKEVDRQFDNVQPCDFRNHRRLAVSPSTCFFVDSSSPNSRVKIRRC